MIRSLLEDAFRHHVWATVKLIDACVPLTSVQLGTSVPGTYGSIIDTVRHTVGADSSYLFAMTGGRVPIVDDDSMDLRQLRTVMDGHGVAWIALLAEDLDPDHIVVRRREDGSETHAPLGIRLAQALHHGTDHRSQVCTALTNLGVEPPDIDAWDFAFQDGRLSDIPPSS